MNSTTSTPAFEIGDGVEYWAPGTGFRYYRVVGLHYDGSGDVCSVTINTPFGGLDGMLGVRPEQLVRV